MRILNLLVLAGAALALSSCSSLNSTQSANAQVQKTDKKTVHVQKNKKNPMAVSFYPSTRNLKIPYRVIGRETISKYNFVGIKRQEASIHDAMRAMAASMGGDAIVDIQHSDTTVTGTVITYQSRLSV